MRLNHCLHFLFIVIGWTKFEFGAEKVQVCILRSFSKTELRLF